MEIALKLLLELIFVLLHLPTYPSLVWEYCSCVASYSYFLMIMPVAFFLRYLQSRCGHVRQVRKEVPVCERTLRQLLPHEEGLRWTHLRGTSPVHQHLPGGGEPSRLRPQVPGTSGHIQQVLRQRHLPVHHAL